MESAPVTFLLIGLAGFEKADDSVVESEIGSQGWWVGFKGRAGMGGAWESLHLVWECGTLIE